MQKHTAEKSVNIFRNLTIEIVNLNCFKWAEMHTFWITERIYSESNQKLNMIRQNHTQARKKMFRRPELQKILKKPLWTDCSFSRKNNQAIFFIKASIISAWTTCVIRKFGKKIHFTISIFVYSAGGFFVSGLILKFQGQFKIPCSDDLLMV